MDLKGVFQILHTPFFENGDIDWDSLESQIKFSIRVGVHGLVIPANASEFYTLSDDERFKVVERALSAISGAVPTVVAVQSTTTRAAMRFAEHAVSLNASALMAVPPLIRTPTPKVIGEYYRSIASLGLDTIIQNAPLPIGTPQSSSAVAELMSSHKNISYLKEEISPILHRITAAIEGAGSSCKGVFGGANGLIMVEEMDRGACGNMPAGGVVDIQVKVFDEYYAGNRAKAIEMQSRLFPLLFHAATYGVTFHKHLLWKRGVLSSPAARDPQAIELDRYDTAAIAELYAKIADLTDPSATFEP